jgi:hypothetical protein
MKKSIFLALVLISTVMTSWAYGDTETRSLKAFSEISVSAGIQATLEKGTVNKIEIDAEGIDLDKVITKVDGDKLIVKIESSWWKMGWNSKRKVKVVISYTEELEEISSSSGASVYGNNVIDSERLSVQASSGARLELEVSNNTLDADVSSGANMDLSGSSKKLKVDVSSGSSFNSYDLVTDEARLGASSGASIKVTVNKSLKASASSGASIKYNGSPDVTDIDKSSGGSVRSN